MTEHSKQKRERSIGIRKFREGCVYAGLGAAGLFTLLITALIVWLLWRETMIFFFADDLPNNTLTRLVFGDKIGVPLRNTMNESVSVTLKEFFFGLTWAPDMGDHSWGIWPMILGTAKIVFVAMCVAVPMGLLTAIWMSEYASHRVRSFVKPVLEILAGIPTVVFGFFALKFITPLFMNMDSWLGGILDIKQFNPLSAGIAVGLLCMPMVCSLTEDAMRAVPRALREGSYGLGANRVETSLKVIFPAALSGVVAAVLLATSRAVGETMVVALAAGSKPTAIVTNVPDIKRGDITLVADNWREGGERANYQDIWLTDHSDTFHSVSEELYEAYHSNFEFNQSAWQDVSVALESDVEDSDLLDLCNGILIKNKTHWAEVYKEVDLVEAGILRKIDALDEALVLTAWDAGLDSADSLREKMVKRDLSAANDYMKTLEFTNEEQQAQWQEIAQDWSDLQALKQLCTVENWVNLHKADADAKQALYERRFNISEIFSLNKDVQPMTGYIVKVYTGDGSPGSMEYYSSYAVGFTLFVLTFLITIVGNWIRKRFRQVYS